MYPQTVLCIVPNNGYLGSYRGWMEGLGICVCFSHLLLDVSGFLLGCCNAAKLIFPDGSVATGVELQEGFLQSFERLLLTVSKEEAPYKVLYGFWGGV